MVKICGSKMDEVTSDWRQLHDEEYNDLYCLPSIIRVIKSRRMSWAGHVARVRGLFVCLLVGRPWQATDVLQPAGLLYRPLWTFQRWPPDAPAPTDAFPTLAAELMGGE
jgi:hypothetical protein